MAQATHPHAFHRTRICFEHLSYSTRHALTSTKFHTHPDVDSKDGDGRCVLHAGRRQRQQKAAETVEKGRRSRCMRQQKQIMGGHLQLKQTEAAAAAAEADQWQLKQSKRQQQFSLAAGLRTSSRQKVVMHAPPGTHSKSLHAAQTVITNDSGAAHHIKQDRKQ